MAIKARTKKNGGAVSRPFGTARKTEASRPVGPGREKLPQSTPLADLELLDREDLLAMVKRMVNGGVSLGFYGKRTAMEIGRRVRPRVTRRLKEFHVGTAEAQSKNLLIEGENLQAMVTLYKYRGQIDLIVTDPPYNTGQYFRYNDRWDEDPNDPELGTLVTLEDGSRHTKWMKAMLPRLQMMKSMLKPQGVIAMCIDDNELFDLGLMMDEIFGEANRLGIVNWQKAHAPKNDSKHLSTATEYILIYAKEKALSRTQLLPRDEAMNRSFSNPDNDDNGDWVAKDPTAREHRTNTAYAIQSPFTGYLHYPNGEYRFAGDLPEARAHWTGFTKKEVKAFLEAWDSHYEERDLGDGRGAALVLAKSGVKLKGYDPESDPVFIRARKKGNVRYEAGGWPTFYFRDDQQKHVAHGRPRIKVYLEHIKQGRVATTFWATEDIDGPVELGSVSWQHEQSGHTDGAKKELDAMVGPAHGFTTVKPLRLMRKIIQLWCPPNGLVLDPYAGSGTTGQAVLELNKETGTDRRFILIEQGRPENGDKYARTLTWQRVRNAITGERPEENGHATTSNNFSPCARSATIAHGIADHRAGKVDRHR